MSNSSKQNLHEPLVDKNDIELQELKAPSKKKSRSGASIDGIERIRSHSIHHPLPRISTEGTTQQKYESYTISDTPSRFVCSLFESINRFEAKNQITIGRIYIILAALIFGGLSATKIQLLDDIPSIEAIFVCFLVAFICNYFLVNGALYKPFLDTDENSYLIKVCGVYAILICAGFYYSLNFITLQPAIVLLFSGFVIVIFIEIFFFNESYSFPQIFFSIVSFVGVILTVVGDHGDALESDVDHGKSPVVGYILCFICGILLSLMTINFGKMYMENFTSMNHIFTMMVVIFLPLFFPIQGVVRPDLDEWFIMFLMGIFMCAGLLCFQRGFQIENPGNVGAFIYLMPVITFLINLLIGESKGFWSVVGSVVTILSLMLFSRESRRKIQVRETFIAKEGRFLGDSL